MYKVRFYNPESNRGFIDGYVTARRAKAVVAAFHRQYEKDGHGVIAIYLGHADVSYLTAMKGKKDEISNRNS